MKLHYIQEAGQLAARAEIWRQRPWLAIDTEFIRVDTYYPKLCLVQVGDGEANDCVDMLALAEAGGAAPLLETLYDTRILKVFHAAAQDLEILIQLGGACPQPLFDTQIAATLLGIGDQIGYAAMIEKLVGATLDKSLSRTDWSRRPLTQAELAYAAADVEYLAQIFPQLDARLAEAGRLAWLAEDCARLADPVLYRTHPEDAWERLKGLARLPPRAQQVAAQLALWREREAQERNRPRKWIVEDDALYRMADRLPQTLAQLEGLQVLPPRVLARHAETLLQAVQDGLKREPLPLAYDDQLTPAQKAQLQKLQERVRAIALQMGIASTFIAPRADLLALALRGPEAQVPVLRGWRREVAGAELLGLLA